MKDFNASIAKAKRAWSFNQQRDAMIRLLQISIDKIESLGMNTIAGWDEVHSFVRLIARDNHAANVIYQNIANVIDRSYSHTNEYSIHCIDTFRWSMQNMVYFEAIKLSLREKSDFYERLAGNTAYLFNLLSHPGTVKMSRDELNKIGYRPEGYAMVANILQEMIQ